MSRTLQLHVFFSFLMSGLMAFMIGAWVTLINLGWVNGFIYYWMKAFLLAWPAGFTIVVLAAPWVRRIAQTLLAFCYSHGDD